VDKNGTCLHWAKFNARRKCHKFKILMILPLSFELKLESQMKSLVVKGCWVLKSNPWTLLEESIWFGPQGVQTHGLQKGCTSSKTDMPLNSCSRGGTEACQHTREKKTKSETCGYAVVSAGRAQLQGGSLNPADGLLPVRPTQEPTGGRQLSWLTSVGLGSEGDFNDKEDSNNVRVHTHARTCTPSDLYEPVYYSTI
jgi:hypothetical protein